jgi:hypothetical protein
MYLHLYKKQISTEQRDLLRKKIITTSNSYLKAYKREKKFRYLFVNRLKILFHFLVPSHLDNLPFPARIEMNTIQWIFKALNYVALIFTNILGFVGMILALRRHPLTPIIIVVLLATLAIVLGYIEQRYLLPAYPFLVILSGFSIQWIAQRLRFDSFLWSKRS